jgi:hypothetical protein
VTCLETDVKKRYRDCDALVLALDSAMSDRPARDGSSSKEVATPVPSPPAKPVSRAVLVAAAVGLVALGFLVRPLLEHKTARDAASLNGGSDPQAELKEIQDWSLRPWSDPIFQNCKGYLPCLERANHVKILQKTDWTQVTYDEAILNDCMAFQKCIERKLHADRLSVVADWAKLNERDKPLLSDCMGVKGCMAAKVEARNAASKPAGNPAVPKPAQSQEGGDEGGVGAQGAGKIFGHS